MESGDCWQNELTLAIRPVSPQGDPMEGNIKSGLRLHVRYAVWPILGL